MKQKVTVLQVGVKSLLINKDKKILLIKKDLKDAKAKGMKVSWDIPGGRINMDENLEKALKREIREETGITAIKPLFLIGAQDIFKLEKHIVRLTYISRVTSSKVSLSNEHSEYRWFTWAEILKLPQIDEYLRLILKDKTKLSLIKDILDR